MKFADAAYEVLSQRAAPVHYRELAQLIVDRQLVATESKSPPTTLHAILSLENRARAAREEAPRFTIKAGIIGLTAWAETKAEVDIKGHAQKIRANIKRQLLSRMIAMSGDQFVVFVAALLQATGSYSNIEIRDGPGDEGVDILCEAEFGVNRLRTAVQAKCRNLRREIGPNDVRLLRDVLPNFGCSQGVFVTTTRFNPDAIRVANEVNRPSILLIDGDRLADLALEHGIGVKAERIAVHSLAPAFFDVLAQHQRLGEHAFEILAQPAFVEVYAGVLTQPGGEEALDLAGVSPADADAPDAGGPAP